MAVTVRVVNIDNVISALKQGVGSRPTIRLGLKISGPAAAYALIWEWGRVTCNPGPKTMMSTNPDGELVVMTKTAPHGFIRVNRNQFRKYVREELGTINWKGTKITQLRIQIANALERAAHRCADLIADTAPVDSGDLREAIRAVDILTDADVPATSDRVSIRMRVRAA